MIFLILHIVRSGETIRVIADNYQCEISDITSNNLHITDFKNLKPGMKLKIPFLTKPIMETLEETESFIKDYYPNLKENFVAETHPETKVDKVEEEVIVEKTSPEEIVVKQDEVKKDPSIKPIVINQAYRGNLIPNIPPKYIKKI